MAAVPNNFRDSISDDEYVARVRRHAPSSLIPLLAATAAKYSAPGSWHKSPWLKFTPWALADIARVSLVSGNEHRAPATLDDLLRCWAAYVAVKDPELLADNPGSLTGFVLRITSEHNKRSVDWIAVCGDTLILVEVKSVRPTEDIRLGKPNAVNEFKRLLGRAFKQLNITDELIARKHPRFAHIPANMPRVALIVTMEPFEVANAKPILDFQEVAPNMPTNVCASSDLELLVTLQDQDIGQFLMSLLIDESKPGYQISTGLKDHSLGRNTVLDDAWASYEWGPEQTGWSPSELGDETAPA